jgi:hypothetical protein
MSAASKACQQQVKLCSHLDSFKRIAERVQAEDDTCVVLKNKNKKNKKRTLILSSESRSGCRRRMTFASSEENK